MQITGIESKEIRDFLGVSQNQTAKQTGINRAYLSMFEANKFSLPEKYQTTLTQYYENLGYEFPVDESNDSLEYLSDDNEEYISENAECNPNATDTESDTEYLKDLKKLQETTNPKLALFVLSITTIVIFHQIAKRNGFDMFDWMSGKLSPKKNNDYMNTFY